ncbi:hypothetical protein, partial [Candidatus Accumulibacter vicinus]
PRQCLPAAPALRLGVAGDPVFGSVIFLGPASTTGIRRGRLVLALPPLNLILAGDLVTRSGFVAAGRGDGVCNNTVLPLPPILGRQTFSGVRNA